MGAGDFLSDVFGGSNDYQYQMSPFTGSPGADARERYLKYYNQNQQMEGDVNAAMRLQMPARVLNMSQSNQTRGRQAELDNLLRSRQNQNIDFGTSGSMGQQQGLIDQILAMGRGEGPNPALQQLRMTTDENAKQAAAMAAANRGINPALAARMASQNMANVNQQAAGQGALQAAQQQIAAQQLGGGLLGQQIGQMTQQAGMNAQQQAQYSQLLANQLAQQRGQDIQSAVSQGQAGLGLLGARLGAEQARRQAQQNFQNMWNQQYVNMNQVNAGTAAQNAATSNQYGQGLMSGLSSGMGMLGLFKGGEVFKKHVAKKMASGGPVNTSGAFLNFQRDDPQSAFMSQAQMGDGGSALSGSLAKVVSKAFEGKGEGIGGTPSLSGLQNVNSKFGLNGAPAGADSMGLSLGGIGPLLSDGGKVPGEPMVDGDSEENDIVPAILSPGEVVIPRSAMKNPESAHMFLDKIIQKNEGPSYKAIMKAKDKYHNLAHGGEIKACSYCNGGYVHE